jgi:DNA-binding FadR family transcriptional regulator
MMSAPQTARDGVFQPLQVEGAVERIVRRLGEAIGSGVLRPGERLPSEVDLAEMLDVAPMTLRQALAILRDAGYVKTRRGRGAGSFVAADLARPLGLGGRVPTERELVGLVDWRRAISGEAAFLAAERGDAVALDLLSRAATATEQAALSGFAVYRLADSGFHIAVAEAAGSPRLVAAETALQAELGEILVALPGTWSTDALRSSTSGHTPILAAILQGRPKAARTAMLEHVEATRDWIVGLHLGRLSA